MKQQMHLLLLVAACAAFAALAPTADAAGAEFTPSVVLTTVKEMENNCEQMVDNALALNSKSIKFVPTVHFYGSETNINSYCFRYDWGSCEAPNKANIERFTSVLAKCIKKAVDAGKDIAVLAHLDLEKDYAWRNNLQFNPNEKKGGYSYTDVVLMPMANAVNRAIKPGTQVIFTINGETGKSVSQYSGEWLKTVPIVRNAIKGTKPLSASDVLIAVSLNYNKVYGWIDFDSISPEYISKNFDAEWKKQSSKFPMDLPNMKKLYEAVDVIGLSAYPPLYPNFPATAMDTPLKYHEQELSYAGIDLKKLTDSGKKLVISEWGIGGGTQDGQGIAPDVTFAAGHPFFGLWYPYSDGKNPWLKNDFAAYRRYLYDMTSKWLKGQSDYKLDKIYVWNAGSWDALGVHYASQGWKDPKIIEAVKAHNKAVNG